MIEISVRHDVAKFKRLLSTLQKEQLPFAISRALNDAAKGARDAVKRELPSIFDRPTLFTQNAIVAPPEAAANKRSLSALVTIRPIQAHYLLLEETGGTRTPAASKALIQPGTIGLDRFGNIPSGTLRKLSASAKATLNAKGKRRSARAGIVYIKGGTAQAHGRAGGFFQRTSGGLVRLAGFVATAKYQPRFGFRSRVEAEAKVVFQRQLPTRFFEALKSAK